MLTQLQAWRESSPNRSRQNFQVLKRLAKAGAARFRASEVHAFLDRVHEYRDALTQLGSVAGLDIVSEDHAALMAIGDRCDVVYKPSGSGRGDFGLAFGTDCQAMSRFAEAAVAAGYRMPIAQVDAEFEPTKSD